MSLRIFSAGFAAFLTACSVTAPDVPGNAASNDLATATPAAQAPEPRIACALGSGDFQAVCTIERVGPRLTIRHPDGGFRRFEIDDDGTIAAADGAEPARIAARTAHFVEVAVGDARYRLPLR